MEPVKGGSLAKFSSDAEEILRRKDLIVVSLVGRFVGLHH